ncbi:MAG TPA: TonB-dependent receptor, partial [Cyclobacteriaceae bacterium]|nr:TonB-dependent receptor [Cyclobacteriaceae bacterium]
FYLFYGNKIGKVNMLGSDNVTYLYTTNIGNSVAKGVEMYANLSLVKLVTGSINKIDVRIFNSLAYTHVRYTNAHKENLNLNGKFVEGVPEWNEKVGFEIKSRSITTTIQTTHLSKQFNDANNTVYSSTGATGVVPSYTLFDWSFQWSFLKNYHISGGVNNLTNTKYFSRRINMYPGPGILPGDGRSFYVSVGVRL